MEFVESDTECLGQFQLKKKMNSHKKLKGKLKKILKTALIVQNTRFLRLRYVASITRQNTSIQKFWKNLLSVFRDWKSHSRGSRELSRENLCVPLVTGPSTREQVAKTDPWVRDWGMRLVWPATESPKQGNTVFEIFSF